MEIKDRIELLDLIPIPGFIAPRLVFTRAIIRLKF